MEFPKTEHIAKFGNGKGTVTLLSPTNNKNEVPAALGSQRARTDHPWPVLTSGGPQWSPNVSIAYQNDDRGQSNH